MIHNSDRNVDHFVNAASNGQPPLEGVWEN